MQAEDPGEQDIPADAQAAMALAMVPNQPPGQPAQPPAKNSKKRAPRACWPGMTRGAGTAPPVDLDSLPEEERKRQIRLQRNRQAAHQSRERKKQLVRNLEEKIKVLTQQNTELSASCRALLAETRCGFPQDPAGLG